MLPVHYIAPGFSMSMIARSGTSGGQPAPSLPSLSRAGGCSMWLSSIASPTFTPRPDEYLALWQGKYPSRHCSLVQKELLRWDGVMVLATMNATGWGL